MRGQRFLEELQTGVLIGDGAIGTELFSRGAPPDTGLERLNLLAPDLVRQLHQDYVVAGSRVIETNTFSANRTHLAKYGAEHEVHAIAYTGACLARKAAGDAVYVAGSVGPLAVIDGEPPSQSERTACFTEQISALLEGGVDLLLLESFTDLDELLQAITIARALTPLPVIAQMVYGREGYTIDGVTADEVARRCHAAGANVVGANCGHGVPSVAGAIARMAPLSLPMSAYMNAGFPEQVEGRLFYVATPEYLARRALDLVAQGVRLIGGCCGTGPETIRAIVQAITDKSAPQERTVQTTEPPARVRQHIEAQPATLQLPVMVELDPPMGLDLAPIIDCAQALKAAGADVITVADNPLASVRVDTLTVAGTLQQKAGLPVMPHLTGRDRNRIALQSTIMGAHVREIRSLLCVTGDPIRFCQDPNTSGVFDVTSVGLVRLVAEFNAGHRLKGDQTAFSIGVALNPNVRTFSGQVEKLRRKIEAGAQFALTQPIFEMERLEMMNAALAEAGIDIPIYVGVMPLLSARNAEFLHNEVPGMRIPDDVRAQLASYATVEDQRAAGIAVAQELVHAFLPHVRGFYFIAPRNRIATIVPLINIVKQRAAVG